MSVFLDTLQTAGQVASIATAFLLCAGGILLSCLSISGTWLVVAAVALLTFTLDSTFPGIWTLVVFTSISLTVEVLEFSAGWLGVTKRGGSKFAGFMAVIGGFLGMALGTAVLPPVAGSLIGMLAGSFMMAFLVEKERLKRSDKAADIAWGAVISRIAVIILKVCVTLGMTIVLATGLILTKVNQ